MPALKFGSLTPSALHVGGAPVSKVYFGATEIWPLAAGATLTADAGTFTLTGVNAAFLRALRMVAETGAFTLTGNAVTFPGAYAFNAETGTFTLTGNAAGLLRALKMDAAAGAFTLTGNAAGLSKTFTVLASGGSFTLTGVDAAFKRALVMQAAAGNFTLTGNAATLTYTPVGSNYALAYRTTDLTSVGTGGSVVGLDTEVADIPGFHSTASDTERFTVTSTFNTRYGRFSGSSRSATEDTEVYCRKNGSTFNGVARQVGRSAGTQNLRVASGIVALATSDYFDMVARDLSGTVTFSGGDFTWGQLEVLPSDFNGCLAYKAATQSLSASTTTALEFDSEVYDLDGFHSTASNTSRQTVPASGVSLVRISGCIETASITAGNQFVLGALKGGASFNGAPNLDVEIGVTGADYLNCMSGPLEVSGSDYFELTAFGPAQTLPASPYSWFQVEELPSDLKWARARLASNFSLSAATTTPVQWDTEDADVGGWVDLGTNNTRLTVPSGVTKVRIVANLLAASSTNQLVVSMSKNGASFPGMGSFDNETAGVDSVNAWSAILDVTAGDYFEVTAFSTNARSLTGGTNSWVSIEEVRF
nr:hypothetical protein RAR13_04380 [Aminobacter aminovorans]